MEEAIAWSYDLLTETQQQCFRALGIFVRVWTLEAAEAVCSGNTLRCGNGEYSQVSSDATATG
jgi:hypothetical protein